MEPAKEVALQEQNGMRRNDDLSSMRRPRRAFLQGLATLANFAAVNSPVVTSVAGLIACDEETIGKVLLNPENHFFALLENITQPTDFSWIWNGSPSRTEHLDKSKEMIDYRLRLLAQKVELAGLLESNRELSEKVSLIREVLEWNIYETLDVDIPKWVRRDDFINKLDTFESALSDCDVGEDGFLGQEYLDEVAQSLWGAMNLSNGGKTDIELSFISSYLKNARISLISSPSSVDVAGECLSEDLDLEKRICSEVEFIINYYMSWAWKTYIVHSSDTAHIKSDISDLKQYIIDSFSEILPNFRCILPQISTTLNHAFAKMELSMQEKLVQHEHKVKIRKQKNSANEDTREVTPDYEQQWQEMWQAFEFCHGGR
jgi:hypothetical protein